ncbi:MAG: hypothetical protein WCW52_12100 [Elusimicrobiales bacterium]|jgi:hypothetical protein
MTEKLNAINPDNTSEISATLDAFYQGGKGEKKNDTGPVSLSTDKSCKTKTRSVNSAAAGADKNQNKQKIGMSTVPTPEVENPFTVSQKNADRQEGMLVASVWGVLERAATGITLADKAIDATVDHYNRKTQDDYNREAHEQYDGWRTHGEQEPNGARRALDEHPAREYPND